MKWLKEQRRFVLLLAQVMFKLESLSLKALSFRSRIQIVCSLLFSIKSNIRGTKIAFAIHHHLLIIYDHWQTLFLYDDEGLLRYGRVPGYVAVY